MTPRIALLMAVRVYGMAPRARCITLPMEIRTIETKKFGIQNWDPEKGVAVLLVGW